MEATPKTSTLPPSKRRRLRRRPHARFIGFYLVVAVFVARAAVLVIMKYAEHRLAGWGELPPETPEGERPRNPWELHASRGLLTELSTAVRDRNEAALARFVDDDRFLR